jgi:hypothetical protein
VLEANILGPAVIEPAIPDIKGPQAYALALTANEIGSGFINVLLLH